MNKPIPYLTSLCLSLALSVGMAGYCAAAETVYKCVKNGKVSYTAKPSPNLGECQSTKIRNDGPSPEELARILAEKERKREQDRLDREAARKERETRAKELEAAAAAQRARALEEQLLLLRQTPAQQPAPVVTYPYFWGVPGPMPRPRPPLYPPYQNPNAPAPRRPPPADAPIAPTPYNPMNLGW